MEEKDVLNVHNTFESHNRIDQQTSEQISDSTDLPTDVVETVNAIELEEGSGSGGDGDDSDSQKDSGVQFNDEGTGDITVGELDY